MIANIQKVEEETVGFDSVRSKQRGLHHLKPC